MGHGYPAQNPQTLLSSRIESLLIVDENQLDASAKYQSSLSSVRLLGQNAFSEHAALWKSPFQRYT